jgi:hypothetical protein
MTAGTSKATQVIVKSQLTQLTLFTLAEQTRDCGQLRK